MAEARLRVAFAGPLVSYQDAGRFGQMRYGAAASGPMDRLAHQAAHAALAQGLEGTAIEVSLGGVMLECLSGEVTFAVTGGGFVVDHAGAKGGSWDVRTLRMGEKLAVRAGEWGSWAYLTFAAEVATNRWLGQSATHSMSGFGGGALATGDEVVLRDARVLEAREGPVATPDFARCNGAVQVVMGPQDQHFQDAAISAFCSAAYELTANYDRMGMMLSGPDLALTEALSIPSEPIIRGSVQVAGHGAPTVLLADHQTTGGYPKIATVISPDLDGLTQLRRGDRVRFTPISAAEAVVKARRHAVLVEEYLTGLAAPKLTLMEKLMGGNLSSGVVGEG